MARRTASFSRQPDNLSLLKPNGFLFVIDKIPTARYFTPRLQLPGISTSPVRRPTNSFTDLWEVGDKLEYEDFTFSCQTDEEMKNVEEIHRWMFVNTVGPGPREYSDATLLILGNKLQTVRKARFYKTFPYMMMQLPFDAADNADSTPMYFDLTFKYQYWEFIE